MIEGANPVLQAFLGTLMTWGLTAVGAGVVFFCRTGQRKILDGSLGFAAGVMTAASFWSLLDPAIALAESSPTYGSKGQWAFVPVAVGFILGALFVFGADVLLPKLGAMSSPIALLMNNEKDKTKSESDYSPSHLDNLLVKENSTHITLIEYETAKKQLSTSDSELYYRKKRLTPRSSKDSVSEGDNKKSPAKTAYEANQDSWKRMLLLIIAITVHNIPEGLAVGVGFGAINSTEEATFEKARNLAIGIGIQNFPEGLAVSLPLRGYGFSVWKSFFWGQLSGMVEPIAGLLGAFAVSVAQPILPYALAFAAGAMIFVVYDDIIAEAQTGGNGKLASLAGIVGFVVMMSLDVALG